MKAIQGWKQWSRLFQREIYYSSGVLFLKTSPMKPGDFEYESMSVLQDLQVSLQRLQGADAIASQFPFFSNKLAMLCADKCL